MNVELIDKTIKNIVSNEDVAQDIWVKILDDKIGDIAQIEILAYEYKRKYKNDSSRYFKEIIADNPIPSGSGSTLFDLMPSLPLEPFNDDGFVEQITDKIRRARVYHSKCPLGIPRRKPYSHKLGHRKGIEIGNGRSGNCKYCGSNRVKLYGSYKGNQRYWCKSCGRKFKSSASMFHKKALQIHIETAMGLINSGFSYIAASLFLYQRFEHTYSKSTISRWRRDYNQKGTIPGNTGGLTKL